MKLDITKLPVAEMVIGFFLVVLAVTFVAAFMNVRDGGGQEDAVSDVSPTPANGGDRPPPDGAINVVMGDDFFDPREITVSAGSTVTFSLVNEGAAIHNMQIADGEGNYASDLCDAAAGDACSVPNAVRSGQEATLEWQAPDSPGEYPFRCDFHPVEMVGVITVQ